MPFREFTPDTLIKSQTLSIAKLNEAGSSPRLPLPVADEGRRGESPRSSLKGVLLVGTPFKSGTASVIDEIGGKI